MFFYFVVLDFGKHIRFLEKFNVCFVLFFFSLLSSLSKQLLETVFDIFSNGISLIKILLKVTKNLEKP